MTHRDLRRGKPAKPVETARPSRQERLYEASQWQLFWRRFFRHRLAVIALVVIVGFYLTAIFADFLSPYDPRSFRGDYTLMPPQRLHFVDEDGAFHLRPFIYGVKQELDMDTWETRYVEDRSERFPVYFIVRGFEYKLLGLFPTDLHLFGTEGGRLALMGTDQVGRDVYSRVLHGSRISLSAALLGILVSFVIGIIIGGLSGYYGGVFDVIVQRLIEAVRSVPTLPLWMGLSVALPSHWSVTQTYLAIILLLSLVGWTSLARVVRGKFISMREEDFAAAAIVNGARTSRIVFVHLLPGFYSHIIAALTLAIPGMILGETALSFIGLGLQPPAISWGVLLRDAQFVRVLSEGPWLLLPGVFVVLSILAFNFLGDGFRDAADPYSTL